VHKAPFTDRATAGRRLGALLADLALDQPLVLGLPRGGVVVAAEVARSLGVDHDVLVVRKIGHPMQPELGLGAVAESGDPVLDEEGLRHAGLTPADLEHVVRAEQEECRRRVAAYRGDRPAPAVSGRTVVLVDDGVATGVTALAAAGLLRRAGVARLVLAAPVASRQALDRLEELTDDTVVPVVPEWFGAVSRFSEHFGQTTDEEVVRLLPGALGG
jgi:putative phosphoribosyl transferase